MKKRILSLVLVLTALIALIGGASAAHVSSRLSTGVVQAGQTVDVILNISETAENVIALQYDVYYDAAALDFTAAYRGDANSRTVASAPGIDALGPFVSVLYVDDSEEGDAQTFAAGTLYTLRFTAREDIPDGTTASFRILERAFDLSDLTSLRDRDYSELLTVTARANDPEPPETGYAVALSGTQTRVAGETAAVTLTVDSQETDRYNAVDLLLSYDADKLTLLTTAIDGLQLKTGDGTLRIQGYGADRETGSGLQLQFRCDGEGSAEVRVTDARVDASAYAVTRDTPQAAVTAEAVSITVGGYPVTLADYFTGPGSVSAGADYTFAAKDLHYIYDITATVGGVVVPVTDNGDGTYTVFGVTGELVITATATPMRYAVTVSGSAAGDVSAPAQASYMTDLCFTLNRAEGYAYDPITVTVGGAAYTGMRVEGDVYIIPGADVVGDIAILAERSALPPGTFSVFFAGSGAGDASGAPQAAAGEDYSFTVTKATGYRYAVSASVAGENVTVVDHGDGSYTVPGAAVTGTLTVTVDKTPERSAEVNEFLKLNGARMYLVVIKGTLEADRVFTYDGSPVFYVPQYGGYAWLTVASTPLSAAEALTHVGDAVAGAETVVIDGDVNCSGAVDVNDVQLAYDMYNACYESFEAAPMRKFLRADADGDRVLTVDDAVKVLSLVP